MSWLNGAYRLAKPLLFKTNPELAHSLASGSMRLLSPLIRGRGIKNREAKIIFDRKIYSPIGIAAGFDKFCNAPNYLHKLGFGFIESGSLTPKPQQGNPEPRLVRLTRDEALLNKMGFNNPGFLAGWKSLRMRLANAPHSYQIALSLGKGKDTPIESAADDYVHCLDLLRQDHMHEYLFYVAINVSSPNTPNLRALQKAKAIHALVKRAVKASPRPVAVKFAPDFESPKLYAESLRATLDAGAAGIIVSNTTVNHTLVNLPTLLKDFGGGLSGKPLAENARTYLAQTLKITKGKVPVISSGGVFSPAEAKLRLDMGADLVQVYTGFVYYGPDFARNFLALE